MSNWKPIPKNACIPAHADGMVLIRKPKASGGWQLELAYLSKGAGWVVAPGGRSTVGFTEYCLIPE